MVFATRYGRLPAFIQKRIDAQSNDDMIVIYDNKEYTVFSPNGWRIYRRGKFDDECWKDIMRIFGGERGESSGNT